MWKISKSKVKSSEAEQQEAVIDWCNTMALNPEYKDLEFIYHCPNGGSRNKAEANNLKRQGVKAGVPDLFLPVGRGGYFGLYIEMKWGKNTPTEEQIIWLKFLREHNYACWVVHSAKVAIDCLEQYIKMPPTTAVEQKVQFIKKFYIGDKNDNERIIKAKENVPRSKKQIKKNGSRKRENNETGESK